MRKLISIAIITVIFSACAQKKGTFIKHQFNFETVNEQADSIVYFMEKLLKTNDPQWEQKFFFAFPNSFLEMENIFGYDDKKGEAPLYSIERHSGKYLEKRIFSNFIGYFGEIKNIPSSLFIEKFIKINIKGKWQADNIQAGFGISYIILEKTEEFCRIASKFKPSEMKSVFTFIFDGPHPKNEYNEKLYKKLKNVIEKYDKELSLIFEKSYVELISSEKNHQH